MLQRDYVRYRCRLSELCSHPRRAPLHTPSTFCRVALTRAQDAAAELELSVRTLLEAAVEAAEHQARWIAAMQRGGRCRRSGRARSTTISSTTVSSNAACHLEHLERYQCCRTGRVLARQLQDALDYHLSRDRGQGRLRRCEGVLCGPLNVENIKIAKTCVAGSPRSGPRRGPSCL